MPKMGFYVEYSEKDPHWKPGDALEETRAALCSRETLVKMLQNVVKYDVKSCQRVNIGTFQENHTGEDAVELMEL